MNLFERTGINKKVFLVLLAASILSSIAILPYIISLSSVNNIQLPPVPLPILIFALIIQAVIYFSIAIFVGLYLGKNIGLGSPLLEGWFGAEPTQDRFVSILKISILLGVLLGAALFILDRFVFAMFVESITAFQAQPPLWQRFLLSFYGGIGEEIFMRLFLMTLIVWISTKIRKAKDNIPTDLTFWCAIIFVSILFGLGHLPMTAQLMKITPIVIIRAVVLNGIAGIVFGWLYWKKGLEAAIISHFSTDIVLHVVLSSLANI